MSIERRNNIVAPLAAHVHLSALMPRVYAIPSFDDSHSPKTQRAMAQELMRHPAKYRTETVYCGYVAGKRTYGLLVYSTVEERAACFAVMFPAQAEA